MTFAKTRCHLAVTAALTACFVASSASAAMLATNDFETSFADFTTDETLAALVAYNGDGPSDAASHPFGSFGDKYLSVDTDDATIWRSFAARSADVYFDSYVKFTPMYDEFAHAADAKFVIYLDSATSNLCVISGTAAGDRTAVTNRLVSAPIVPNTWGRLTVNATASDGVFAFQVKLNGTLLATSGGVSTFYSLSSGTTLSEVGVGGSGALDNFAVRTTDPFGTAVATINGEGYASLEDALAEADADTVVTLAADHAGKVYLADAATYKIAPGTYSFGGVVGANGYKVTAGEPVAGVTTYTAADAFASQPVPVVLWDGASENYDFNTLTRTVGATTYTLNLNGQNTVGGNGAYVQIGPNNAQAGVTLTAASANAFGTDGQVTVIMKCSALNLSDNTYRGLVGLLADEGGYYSGDNNEKIGIATGFNASNGAGAYTCYIANGVYNSSSANTTAYSTGAQTICMTYSSASGTCIYRNGSLIASSTGVKYGTWMAPTGVALGGMDLEGSSRVWAQTGMKIEAVAVFASTLTAEQVAAYSFPSQRIAEDVAVSEINAIFGSAGEIWLDVADGVTITGDTTFNASIVHLTSPGEVVLYPSAGNEATLDFAGVAKPVVAYSGVLPTASGDAFTATTVPTWVTDPAQWTGTVWLKNKTDVTAFESNPYGNASSVLRLTGIKGWLKTYSGNGGYTNAVPVELSNDGAAYGLWVSDGYSANENYPQRYTVFNALRGGGTFKASEAAGNRAVLVVRDGSGFTGNLDLTTKVAVFGEKMPELSDTKDGQIYVMPGATLDVPSDATWTASEVTVAGALTAASLARLSADTPVVLCDTGVIDVPGTGSVANFAMDFSMVSGTGAIKYTGASWGGISTNGLAGTLGVVLENTAGVIIPNSLLAEPVAPNEIPVGHLAGTGNLRSDLNWRQGLSVENQCRVLKIHQDRDNEWSGIVSNDGYERLTFSVTRGTSSSGTLTLSGTQTQTESLVVESDGKVNLAGTWVGPVAAHGTLGGTGAVTGDLTLAAGATLKVSDVADPLSVSGNLSATGAIAIELPAGALAGGSCTLLSLEGTADLSGATFTATVGGESVDLSRHEVKLVNGQLVLQPVSVKRGTGLLLF